MKDKHWQVSIDVDGENILYMSPNEICGVDNIEDYRDYILYVIENLRGFIGTNSSSKSDAELLLQSRDKMRRVSE